MTNDHWDLVGTFCEQLDNFLMERFDYKTAPSYRTRLAPMVDARRKKFDLYFRLFEDDAHAAYWGGRTLIISRIGFSKPRKGHGTSLLRLITGFALAHNYELIGIERAETPSIKAFAAKYGFRKIDENGNYTVPAERLSTTFSL